MNNIKIILSLFLFFISYPAYPLLFNKGYIPKRHDRFYSGEDKAFIGKEFDWSGIGRVNGNYKWATMISDHFFLSAYHFHPVNGDQLWFWPENNLDQHIIRTVVWGKRAVNEEDCWVGMLNESVPENYSKYKLFYRQTGDYNDFYTFYVGKRPDHTGIAIGKRPFRDYKSSLIYLIFYGVSLDQSNLDYVEGVSGDSGAPTFAIVNGELALMGNHYASGMDEFSAQFINEINEVIMSAPTNNQELIHGAELEPKLKISDNELLWLNTSGYTFNIEQTEDLQKNNWILVTNFVGEIERGFDYKFNTIDPRLFFRIKYEH